MDKPVLLLFILVMTLLSGWSDSRGFIHAAKVWQDGKLVWGELGQSALGFGVGILIYWIILRPMRDVGIVTPEVQTLLWFAVTLVGVAVATGHFFQWQMADQLVAVIVMTGIGWLVLRTAGTG